MNDERPTPVTVLLSHTADARKPRPRAPFTVTVSPGEPARSGIFGNYLVYRVTVMHDEGEFVETCAGSDAVGKYLRGLDAGAFPAEIEWPKGWEHYR